MGVKEIEVAITRQSVSELTELALWFENYQMQRWDHQSEEMGLTARESIAAYHACRSASRPLSGRWSGMSLLSAWARTSQVALYQGCGPAHAATTAASCFPLEADKSTGDEVILLLDIGTHEEVY